jgi:prevent-host-death family protein
MIKENIYAAKTHLSKLIEKVLQGEEVVIAKAGKPVARLVPFTEKAKPIKYGTLKGKIKISDDFNDYSGEVAEMFSEYEPEGR